MEVIRNKVDGDFTLFASSPFNLKVERLVGDSTYNELNRLFGILKQPSQHLFVSAENIEEIRID